MLWVDCLSPGFDVSGIQQARRRHRKKVRVAQIPAAIRKIASHRFRHVMRRGTYTLNGSFGSGVTVPGTGVLLNNEMDDFSSKAGEANQSQLAYEGQANIIQPHKTPLSSMSPTIVIKDGKVFAVLGSPGGPTIINTVIELLVNLIDFKMNAADAVDFPRFHHQWMPDRLQLERGFSPDTVERLKALGHQVEMVSQQGEAAVVVVKDGWCAGAADPRTEGTAKGY